MRLKALVPMRFVVLAAAFTASTAACARNPVTGRLEPALISESQEIEIGRQAALEVQQTIGLIQDEELQQYIQNVGASLAAESERPELPWTFRAVDDPTPNAFALPGGYIFVTRGLLNLMENEAQLASVLGHEIAHVTARHSVQMISRQQLAQLGLGIGMILVPELQQFGDLAGTGLQLLFLKYGRDAERQADDLGFNYALGQGYDVREMPEVFAALERVSQLEDESPLPSWLATHPYPAERIERISARIQEVDRSLAALREDRPEYLGHIEGLVYGEDPREGYFQGNVFIHPELRFRMAFPPGWQVRNTKSAVIAVGPNNQAAIQLTLAQGQTPQAAAQAFLGQQGIQAGQVQQTYINSVPAVAATFQAQTQQGTVQGLVTFLSYGGNVYQVMGFAPAQVYSQYDRVFQQALGSFSAVTDPGLLAVEAPRIAIVRVDRAMTLAEFNQRYPSTIPIEELAIINQIPVGATIPAGTLVKRVVK